MGARQARLKRSISVLAEGSGEAPRRHSMGARQERLKGALVCWSKDPVRRRGGTVWAREKRLKKRISVLAEGSGEAPRRHSMGARQERLKNVLFVKNTARAAVPIL
jgi:hypothetical protein